MKKRILCLTLGLVLTFSQVVSVAASTRKEELQQQLEEEEKKTTELEEYKIYVQTKQFIESEARQKFGLVNPDEILLKPES